MRVFVVDYQKKIIHHTTIIILGAAWLCLSLLMSATISPTQTASAAPFTCDSNFYQFIGADFARLNPDTGEYETIISDWFLNAAGYNRLDNYIYGYAQGSPGSVVRVQHDGTRASIGAIAGLPPATSFYAGDVDENGNLYLYGGGTDLYRVNLTTNVATLVSLSVSLDGNGMGDLVYIDGMLYGLANTALVVVNPITGVVTTHPIATGQPTTTYGAGWAADDSKLFFAHNGNGIILEITNFTTASPQAAPVLQGQPTTFNDGASCSLARSPIPPLFATNDNNQTQVNTPVTGNVLANDSGREITVTSYTQPSNGTVVVNPDGSYTYTPNDGFAGTDTFTYTITDEYGETRTATVTITIAAAVAATPADEEELASSGSPAASGAIVSLGLLSVTISAARLVRTNKRLSA